jgi:hypothetical protein
VQCAEGQSQAFILSVIIEQTKDIYLTESRLPADPDVDFLSFWKNPRELFIQSWLL